MRRLRTLAMLFMTGAIGGNSALAADGRLPPVLLLPAYGYSWVGSYLGVHGGWDSNDSDNGGIVGVFAGWNFLHIANWIWGVDASLNWTDATSGGAFKGWLRGRAGVGVDRVLLYGTLGAAGFDGSLGWTIGAGADVAVTNGHFLRVDYSHQDYSGSWGSSDTLMVGLALRLY
jgi:outer membrane immunogenic protein